MKIANKYIVVYNMPNVLMLIAPLSTLNLATNHDYKAYTTKAELIEGIDSLGLVLTDEQQSELDNM